MGVVPFPVDLSLFEGHSHSPPLGVLQRSMGPGAPALSDFCIPVNLYFPTPRLFADLRANLETALRFYPAGNEAIAAELAAVLRLPEETLVMANGSTELITWIDWLLVRDRLATPVPTFGRWTDHPTEIGRHVAPFVLRPEEDFRLDPDAFIRFVRRRGARAAAICNPNNPTAGLIARQDVLRLCDALADLDVVVIDESFIDFADDETVPSIAAEATLRRNVVVLKSLGKNFGLHGLRAGYAVASPPLADRLRSSLPHWNVNGVAEFFIRALKRHWGDYESGRRRTVAERVAFERRLRRVPGLVVFPSMANFVYVRLPRGVDGVAVRNRMLCQHGCLIRECSNKLGSDGSYLRLAVRPADEGRRLVWALRETVAFFHRANGRVAVA